MNKLKSSHVMIASTLSIAFWVPQVQAAVFTRNYTFTLDNSQIEDNTLPFNDVWESGNIDIGEIISLDPGDSFVANIKFADRGHLMLDDGFFNGNESIKIKVDGEGGVGGAPNNRADYSFLFTGVHGGPFLENPIDGQLTINALNGNVDFNRNINLINGGTVKFHDLHLTLTNRAPNRWSFDKFGVGVDADTITIGVWVPEPSGILGTLSALGIGAIMRRKQLTRRV